MRVEPARRINNISPTQRREAKVIMLPVNPRTEETEEDALLRLFDDTGKIMDKLCYVVLCLAALYMAYHLIRWWLG